MTLADSGFISRLNFFYPGAPQSPLALVVERPGAANRVSLRSVTPGYARYEDVAQLALIGALESMKIVFFAVAAVIVIRRAENLAARALATFLIALAFGTVNIWPWYPPAVAVAVITVRAMAVVFALTQAIRFATIFPRVSRNGSRAAIARVNRWASVAILVSGAVALAPLVLPSVSARF